MAELHERLLAELADNRYDSPTEVRLATGHRAVVELHRPVRFWRPYPEPEQCFSCRSAGPASVTVPWPCSTIRTIARELGVETGDDHG